ncbi:MAG: formylglycine-generating enzyme family protein [Saprospiraceae bacterium]
MNHPPIRSYTAFDHPFHMILVEGGTFRMGMESDDVDSYGDEQPVHEVTVPNFYLGQLPVTQAFWQAVMGGDAPAFFTGAQRPVEQVSWDDAQAFIKKLLDEKPDQFFRLPTEAEWEFAARGGKLGLPSKYAGSNHLKEVAWFDTNSHGETKTVGQKFRNELGLYDMSGNVWEWCEDDWHDNYKGAPDDGSTWVEQKRGASRVLRGGGWSYFARSCRTAYRSHWRPDHRSNPLGFRLALSLQSED